MLDIRVFPLAFYKTALTYVENSSIFLLKVYFVSGDLTIPTIFAFILF